MIQCKNCGTLVSSWAFARLSTAMAKNTLRSVSSYSLSQEKMKCSINKKWYVQLQLFFKSVINWNGLAGYSFQREWEQWNKWRRTFPHEHLPVTQSHDTWRHSSPPQLGSARRNRFVSDSSAVQAEEDRNHFGFDLYLENSENRCWECVKVGCWRLIFKIKP